MGWVNDKIEAGKAWVRSKFSGGQEEAVQHVEVEIEVAKPKVNRGFGRLMALLMALVFMGLISGAHAEEAATAVALPAGLSFSTLVTAGVGIIGTIAVSVAAAAITFALIKGGIAWVGGVMRGK